MFRRINAKLTASSRARPETSPELVQQVAEPPVVPSDEVLRVAEALTLQYSLAEHAASPQLLQQIHLSNIVSVYLRHPNQTSGQEAYRAVHDYLIANGAEIGAVSPQVAIEFTRVIIAGTDAGMNVIETLDVMGPSAAVAAAHATLAGAGVEPRPLPPVLSDWAADICRSYVPPMPGPANTGTI